MFQLYYHPIVMSMRCSNCSETIQIIPKKAFYYKFADDIPECYILMKVVPKTVLTLRQILTIIIIIIQIM